MLCASPGRRQIQCQSKRMRSLGHFFQAGLAQIEARAGEAEEAVKRLRQLLSIPAGQPVSIARLKIDPVWDPLRDRPDFQQLLSGPEQIGPNR